MQRLPAERLAQNQVLAVFEASALSFKLPRTATFEDLARRLAYLAGRREGALVSVDVRRSAGV
jgi:hypothetical protein